MDKLAQKVKTYRNLQRGMTGGMTEEEIAALPLYASADLQFVAPN